MMCSELSLLIRNVHLFWLVNVHLSTSESTILNERLTLTSRRQAGLDTKFLLLEL